MERKTKYILLGLSVLAIGTGTYIYVSRQRRKNAVTSAIEEGLTTFTPSASSGSSSSSSGKASDDFPLKKGSRGALVKSLQNALIKKYGQSILPKYGADGDFGSETINALQSKGLPTTIDSSTYTSLLMNMGASSGSSSSNMADAATGAATLAALLHKAINNSSFSSAIAAIKQIKSVSQYSAVSAIFKQTRIGLVRKTLVTGLLQAFTASSQKKALNEQFHRIGLKFDGSKWSLSGLAGIYQDKLVTIKRTKVWGENGNSILVPAGTIIGEYLDANNGVTQVETLDGKQLFVKTAHIKYS